jgi:hypothetical protein
MGFSACQADADVWLRKNAKPNGSEYYEYLLVYVDDILVVSHNTQSVMDTLSEHYTLKAERVRPPKEYLGSDISTFDISPTETAPASTCWLMSAETYIKHAVKDAKRTIGEVSQICDTYDRWL